MKPAARSIRFSICAIFFVLFAMSANSLLAQQTTGDILGTVTDPSGAALAGALVTIQNLDTHETRKTTATATGDYVFNLLNPGTYMVDIKAKGFSQYNVPSVALNAGDRERLNAQLAVGSESQTVTVEATASSLQTDSSVLSNVIGEKATQDLPLNGRNFAQLIQLQPGVNEGTSAGGSLIGGQDLDDQRQDAGFQANGQSEVLNNQMIDGADNFERLIGSIAVRPSVDAIGQMVVQTSTYTAEVGRTGGAVVNIITKAGTDKFHGDVFEFFRNDVLNANTYNFGQMLPKAELRLNQFGGGLGGPIVKNKLFFFGSYEGYRLVQASAPYVSVVPTLAEHNQALAYINGAGSTGIDFSDTGGPALTAAQLDPVGAAYVAMNPAPNGKGSTLTSGLPNEYIAPSVRHQQSNTYDGRVDYNINADNSVFGRFIYNRVLTKSYLAAQFPVTTIRGLTLDPSLGTNANDTDYDGLLNYIHTFTPHLVMELKAAYTRADNRSSPLTEGQNPMTAFGANNINTNDYGTDATGLALVVNVQGTTEGGVIFMPIKDQDNTFQYLGSVTYTRGPHNIKMGASFIRRQLTSFQSSYAEGLWVFLNYPFLAQGQFITNSGRSLDLFPPHLRVSEPSVYAQDDWRVSKNLTVNLGLRYDVYTPYKEIQNRISTWDPSSASLLVAGQNGVSNTAGIQTDYHGLQPRVGFAYSPSSTFVVRGGFSMSFFPENITSNANLKNAPFVATTQACNSPGFGSNTCPAGFTSFAGGFPAVVPTTITSPGLTIPDAVDPHFRTSYVEQYNLTAQKDFSGNVVTLSYVGMLGKQLGQLLEDLNAAAPGNYASSAAFQSARPYNAKYPNLGLIGFFKTGGVQSYNALTASLERRIIHGLSFNANYTYSRNLDNATGLSQENTGGYALIPSQVSTRDYGNSNLDFRNHMAATLSYALPFGANRSGFTGALIKGWQANFIQVWTSGQPFTVVNSSNVAGAIPGYDDRPNQVASYVPSNRSIGNFFNANAFVAQAPGTVGNERRNQLYGPHYRHSDLSLFKTFPIHDSLNAEFRVECFNLANTANWNLPNATLGGANFGQVTSMSYSYTPRIFQLALKLNF